MPRKPKPLPAAALDFSRHLRRRLNVMLRHLLAEAPPGHRYFKLELLADFDPRDRGGLMFLKVTSCSLPKGQALVQTALTMPARRVADLKRALAEFEESGPETIQ
jgi:hypothetical protein